MICPGSHSSEVVEPGLEPGSGDRIQLDFLEIRLTCHVILVSGVQQNDAVCANCTVITLVQFIATHGYGFPS